MTCKDMGSYESSPPHTPYLSLEDILIFVSKEALDTRYRAKSRKIATNYRAFLQKITYLEYNFTWRDAAGWPRPIGCLIFIGHFLQKSPTISGSFAEGDLQLIRHPMGLCQPVGLLTLEVGALTLRVLFFKKALLKWNFSICDIRTLSCFLSKKLVIEDRALLIECRALLTEYKARLTEYRALLTECRALLYAWSVDF